MTDEEEKEKKSGISEFLGQVPLVGWFEIFVSMVALGAYLLHRDILELIISIVSIYFLGITTLLQSRFKGMREICNNRLVRLTKNCGENTGRLCASSSELQTKLYDRTFIPEIIVSSLRNSTIPNKGKARILEDEAVALMSDYAESFQHSLIATSYYDVVNWGKLDEKDIRTGFWRPYLSMQIKSANRIRDRIALRKQHEEKLDHDDAVQVTNDFLDNNPIIRRIFIIDVDKDEENWKTKWQGIKRVINQHLESVKQKAVHGYEIKCIEKSNVNLRLVDVIDRRLENLHDFVIFDNELVVEVTQVHSLWGRGLINTYGLVYVQPKFGLEKEWVEKFYKYFEDLYRDAIDFEEFVSKVEG